MAFSPRRGRPRAASGVPDHGTPELRRKRELRFTAEPIDQCLEKGIIAPEQHRSALHLRWLYTLRYGAPALTTRYFREDIAAPGVTCEEWRSAREQEYLLATRLLTSRRLVQPVVRLAIYNELPAFLNPALLHQSWQRPALAERLENLRLEVQDGLELLTRHWRPTTAAATPQHGVNC